MSRNRQNRQNRKSLSKATFDALEPRQLMAANAGLHFAAIGELNGMPSGTPAQAYADLNGDGRLDMIRSSGIAPNATSVWLGNGNGGFSSPTFYAGGGNSPKILVGDVTGDGRADVLHVNNNEKTITVLRSVGDGTLALQSTISLGAVAPNDAALVDWTRDGVLDLVVSGYDGFALRGIVGTLIGGANGSFGSLSTYSPSIQTEFTAPLGIATGDFNGDNWQDFIVTHQNIQRGYQLYLNNQNGTFDRQPIQLLASDIPGLIATADFNRDGFTDFAFTCTSTGSYGSSFPTHDLTIAMNNANAGVPTFTMSHHQIDTDRGYLMSPSSSVVVADMDGDGKKDILFGGSEDSAPGRSFIRILRGDDNGNFTPAKKQQISVGTGNIAVPDLNNDGAPDLMVTTTGNVAMSRMLANFTSLTFGMNPSETYTGQPAFANVEVRTTTNASLPVTSTTWYSASDPNTPIPAPTNVGNYVLHAHYSGDANNPPATGSVNFAITPAAPTVTVNIPFLNTYTGNPITATATATGVQGETLGSGSVQYFLASDTTFSNPITPINVGDYVARGTFAGGGNYSSGTGTASFQIYGATPTVTVNIPTRVPFTGAPVQATGTVTGINGENLGSPTFTYYFNTDGALLNPLPAPPSAQRGYFVVARYQPAGNYGYGEAVRQFFIISAESLVVTTADDQLDDNASPDLGGTSLREALRYAEQKPGPDTITFAPGLAGQTIQLSGGWNGSGDNTALRVSSDVTLQGPETGVTIAVAAGAQKRHLFVASGAAFSASKITFSGGNVGDLGGAILNSGTLTLNGVNFNGNSAASLGGAINNDGTANIVGSTFTSNSAGEGGAIQNVGTLNISTSTFSNNASNFNGGALRLFGTATIDRSTFNGNTIANEGGALISFGNTTITNSTFASNGRHGVLIWEGTANLDHLTVAYNTDGGMKNVNAAMTLRNSIVAGNASFDLSGTLASGSTNNLVNLSAAAAKLDVLASNGGPTQTIALLPGSPAINAGVAISGLNTDQRGTSRPQGTLPDIGSYERIATNALLQSSSYEFETRQAVTFNFDADASVTFARENISIQNLTTGMPVGGEIGSLSFDATGQAATLLLTNALPDGRYRATAGATALDFTVFAGDANRDSTVNITDFAVLAARFNQPGTFSQGDFNYDGSTDIADFSLLASKFNTSLPAARSSGLAATRGTIRFSGFSNSHVAGELIDSVDLPA